MPMSEKQSQYLKQFHRRKQLIIGCRIVCIVLFLLLWEVSTSAGWINDFIFSSPSRMCRCMVKAVTSQNLIFHIAVTLLETLFSFLIVTVLSILISMLLWSFPTVYAVLEPILVMLNSLPKSALAPVMIVWLGNNIKTVIVTGILLAIFASVISLTTGFYKTDGEKIRLMYTLGASRKDILLKLLLPSSVPLIMSSMKVNIGLCLVGVIIGEFLAAKAGLGYLIIYSSQVFQMDMVMLSIVILCAMAILMYQGITWISNHIRI